MAAAAEIEMIVRRPEFNFEDSERIWLPANPAFAYELNGGSLVLPYLEPYLIRVMRQAREALGDRLPSLRRDIDLFNGQEANHFKLHARYNQMLRARYDGIEELEAEIEADFARMLREESLEFNLGYSAGFETTGMITAQLYFGDEASLEGADPATAGLWAWHLAEEYEHRCVAFEVFRAFGGTWRERIRMFFYQNRHLRSFGGRAARLMREQDERAGRLVLQPQAIRRMQRLGRRQALTGAWLLGRALLPWHDPRKHGALGEADRFLDGLETPNGLER